MIELSNVDSSVISLTASVFQTLTALNIVVNNDATTFEHNAETGEITIKRLCRLYTSGSILITNADEETPNVEIWLAINGVNTWQLCGGVSWYREFSTIRFKVIADDVLTVEIMCSETIDMTVESGQLTLKR